MSELPLWLIPAAPLVLALVLYLPGVAAVVRALVALAPLPALMMAYGDAAPLRLDWLLLGTDLAITDIARPFLVLTALLWALAGWQLTRLLADHPAKTKTTLYFLLAMSGNLGLLIAQDMASFYTFFAMMSLASWGLVLHGGGAAQIFAGRVYVTLAIIGEIALFAGLTMGSFAMNDLQMSAMAGADVPPSALALVCLGFLIKLGAVPLHVWLPLAHAAAPAPASAVLSGAMLKAGLFGLIVVLPLGQTALPGFALAFAVMAVAGLVLALVLGLVQGDPKAVLAYSSIGQMSLILLGLSAALAAPSAWGVIAPALVLLALNHAFAKAALFLGVPVVWSTQRGGLRVAVLALMALPALALTGVPGTNGGLAKSAMKSALEGAPDGWALWLGTAFFIASFGTGVLMIRAVFLLADAPYKPEIARDVALPWAIMSGLVVFGFALAGVSRGGGDAAPLADYYPLATALLAALLMVLLFRRARLRLTPATPGELLGLFVQDESPTQDPVTPVAVKSGTAIGVSRGKRGKLRPERGALAILCIAATLVLITALSPTTPVAPPPAAPEAVE